MKKIIAIVVAFVAMVMVTGKVQAAGVLKSAKVSLDNPVAAANSTYVFTFTHADAASIDYVDFQFCTTPSGACTATNTTVDAATFNTTTGITGVATPTNWSATTKTGNHVTLQASAADTVNQNAVMTVTLGNVSNGALTGNDANCGGVAQPSNSSTCYVRIGTYNGAVNTNNIIDTTVISYTRVQAVTVTAKVDPTFTFLVSGVDSNITRNGVKSSVQTQYNQLPFGNLTVGQPKYAMHELRVKTNTTAGYTVSVSLPTQLTGVYTSNNIDPFVGSGATYAAPKDWTSPTGQTANDNTGWFGFDTSDTDIPNGAQYQNSKFAGLDSTSRVIMSRNTSDDGTEPVYITYALEANVFQPSDSYTGVLVYNALPTY